MPAKIRTRTKGNARGKKYPLLGGRAVDEAFEGFGGKRGLIHTATREPFRGVFTEGPQSWERKLISTQRKKERLRYEKIHAKQHKKQREYDRKHPDNLRIIQPHDELTNLFARGGDLAELQYRRTLVKEMAQGVRCEYCGNLRDRCTCVVKENR